MDTISAFMMGQMSQGSRVRVFDWDKAAKILAEVNPEYAEAGLREDWEWTGGVVWEDGMPVTDSYTYLSSTWAEPCLKFNDQFIDCWVYADESTYDEHTKWPESALNLISLKPPTLGGEVSPKRITSTP